MPLQTGILALDAMIPIGRGQRELIIGDRQTGKTALAIDTIINQKGQNVICIYASIGQKASTTAQVVETLRRYGALELHDHRRRHGQVRPPRSNTWPPIRPAPSPSTSWTKARTSWSYTTTCPSTPSRIAPYPFSCAGRPDARPIPGDVFYLHSRLFERAARLSPEKGGGSITALPIVETQGGDISAYIPTNVISITDGQIFLLSELFFSGVRPAVDVGLSVSRVGGAAQSKAVRKIAGRIRLDLAQYRELAVFAQFGSDLDKATQDQLAHGKRLVEVLKQPQYAPMPLAEEIVILFAAVNGYLSEVKVEDIRGFLEQALKFMKYKHKALLETLQAKGELSPEAEAELRSALDEYRSHKKAD